MSIVSKLKWRYATKKFDSNKKLSSEQLQELLEAGNLTATSVGLQPIRLLVVENPALRAQILPHAWGQNQVVDASHLLVLATVLPETLPAHVDEYIARAAQTRGVTVESLDGFKNMITGIISSRSPAEQRVWAEKQAYIALGQIMTAAAALEIDTCPMEGFVPSKVDEILDLQAKGLASVLMLPVGFRAEDDKYASTPKVRLGLDQFVQTL